MHREIALTLAALERQQLKRACRVLDPTTGPTIRCDGRDVLQFASNDYLGLVRDPRVIAAAQTALAQYGLGSGSSRLMSGTSSVHQQLEERLAAFKGEAAALVFSSGYLTNLGVIASLVGAGDVVITDHANHASLIDGCRLSGARLRVYAHSNLEALATILQASASARRRLIVTDGVFSMDGDVAKLIGIQSLAERYDAWWLVDDAHGAFVLGEHGRGSVELCQVSSPTLIQMGTLSKALGALGGYVTGSRALMDYCLNRARSFIYSTALPPAVAAGAIAALDIVEQEPERRARVLALAERLRQGLKAQGWNTLQSTTQIVPVLVGDAAATLRAAEQLLARGIFAPAIRPPTVPRGTGRLRLSLTALHAEEQVDRCLEAFGELTQCAPVASLSPAPIPA